jgi:4-amino-4-deoxy-L-arabinose transferase-like glycosyltransferase
MSANPNPLQLAARSQRSSLRRGSGARTAVRRLVAWPELFGVLAVAAVLNLWNLSINGEANDFYAAAIKAMASNWHDFIFNSMDKAGLMTVDKPPLSDWIQALSVRVFGWSSWSLLAPQALMGVAAAGLMYDLTRRRFGRVAGTVAGVALATTPTIVAVSRHNNPDELLVLLCVAAVWCTLRALETGRTKWLVWSGVMVGLGFETKMGVALMLVPGIALAWLWMRWGLARGQSVDYAAPGPDVNDPNFGCLVRTSRTKSPKFALRALRANLSMIRQLLWGGVALFVVGLAWPVLVTLTPAADRPWISGTSDNSVWSLMFGYNGLGRIAGQTGGPSGGGGGFGGGTSTLFGGSTGVFRLIGSALGDQAGWLLGFAVVAAVALVVMTRMRRSDPRTGFVLVIGVTLLLVGGVFSFASGIFHPYYVSMVAPWAAALIGAGVGETLPAPFGVARSEKVARIVGPALVIGGAITELVVLSEISGALGWARVLVIIALLVGAPLLALGLVPRVRLAGCVVVLAFLLAAPVTWAAQTLGHATSGTFPTGGPASASVTGGGPGGGGPGGGFGGGSAGSRGTAGAGSLFGGSASGARSGSGGFPGGPPGGGTFGGGGGAGSGSTDLNAAAAGAQAHGGGTVAVESQSTAAQAILAGHTNVAGIGGFSGLESSVTAKWITQEVKEGRLKYILGGSSDESTAPSDGRSGSAVAIAAAEHAAKKLTIKYDGQTFTLYELKG